MLDTHSQIRSPQELHLKYLTAHLGSDHCRLSMELLGYSESELTHLLWDRLLHAELHSSGKKVLVEKSPCNVQIIDQIQRCWPGARFIVLLRHPLRAARSMIDNFQDHDLAMATRRLTALDEVLQRLRGQSNFVLTVNYESLVAFPEQALRQICVHLDLVYEPEMLHYGQHDHGPYIYGLGDWGERIRSGIVLPERAPREVPRTAELANICKRWGYDESRS